MTFLGLDRKEVADLSAKTRNGIVGFAVMEATGLAAAVGVVALDIAAAASLGTVLGEVVGRGIAEFNLPKEYKKGYGNVLDEAGGAVAQDVKWVAGKVVEAALDLPVPGLASIAAPVVDVVTEKTGLAKKYDNAIGLEEHQASATTFVADKWSEAKEGFKSKLATFRGARAGSEPETTHAAPAMKV